MSHINIVLQDMKELMSGSRPLANVTDGKGNPCYYNVEPLEDDFERTSDLAQSFTRCFCDALHELESYGSGDLFFDELAEVDFLTAGLDAEKGDFEAMTQEIHCFDEKINAVCKQEQSFFRQAAKEMEEDEESS